VLLEPIGFLRCERTSKFLAPSQPAACEGVVELNPGLEPALHDLEGFSRIWLIWWFHKNSTWRPKVLPPQGRTGRKGVFATRSPHRPCPLGLSCVTLLRVEGLRVFLGGHDLVDGTPVLDIKPYIPRFDSFPEATSGWFGELETRRYEVEWAPEASLEPTYRQRVLETLEADPLPHRTRRIMKLKDGSLRLACGDYRVYYTLEGSVVRVERVLKRETR
jgi:tRNA-Thr(GGU) m(6)t(6)A37 methyltransferase TsaA